MIKNFNLYLLLALSGFMLSGCATHKIYSGGEFYKSTHAGATRVEDCSKPKENMVFIYTNPSLDFLSYCYSYTKSCSIKPIKELELPKNFENQLLGVTYQGDRQLLYSGIRGYNKERQALSQQYVVATITTFDGRQALSQADMEQFVDLSDLPNVHNYHKLWYQIDSTENSKTPWIMQYSYVVKKNRHKIYHVSSFNAIWDENKIISITMLSHKISNGAEYFHYAGSYFQTLSLMLKVLHRENNETSETDRYHE